MDAAPPAPPHHRHHRHERRWPRFLLLAGALAALVGLIVVFANSMMQQGTVRRPAPQQIALLRPQTPPPPPKQEEKPPEPEPLRKQEEVQVADPVQQKEPEPQQQDQPPPDSRLGVDAEGGAGSDAFGLVGKRGGRDITTIGPGGGGGGPTIGGTGSGRGGLGRSQYAFYTGMVDRHLRDLLDKDERLRHAGYRVVLAVWLADDGRLERFEMSGSTGVPELDSAIKAALADGSALREPPPAGMPQPIVVRIASRRAG